MDILELDGRSCSSPRALHEAIGRQLPLPGYYGANADALYDVLSERTAPLSLEVRLCGEGPVLDELMRIIRVFRDLGWPVSIRL